VLVPRVCSSAAVRSFLTICSGVCRFLFMVRVGPGSRRGLSWQTVQIPGSTPLPFSFWINYLYGLKDRRYSFCDSVNSGSSRVWSSPTLKMRRSSQSGFIVTFNRFMLVAVPTKALPRRLRSMAGGDFLHFSICSNLFDQSFIPLAKLTSV
jgi:hypothetical protein